MSAHPTPVSIAEQILQLVQINFDASSPQTDLQALYDAKIRVQDLCNSLLQATLGRLEYTTLLAESCQESSALGFISRLGVADVIGDKDVTLDEISKSTGSDPRFLSIALSSLSKHDYFEEVGGFGSKVYRNNELSEILREDHPESVKDASSCDEGFKATSYLLEASKPSLDGARRLPAVNLAFGFNNTVFEWMADQAWRGRRMGKAMQQLHLMANGNVVFDYPWNQLASPVVDVGGGIGSLELALLKREENAALNFTIFDIPATIENAKKTWANQSQSASSRVGFASGNFLAATLDETCIPRGMPTYLIRHVLHDWTDDQVVMILNNVRQAMLAAPGPASGARLVLCEMLLRSSSARFVRTTSMQLLALNNGITRTETEMVNLVEKSGFKVIKVHHMRAVDSIIEARPDLMPIQSTQRPLPTLPHEVLVLIFKLVFWENRATRVPYFPLHVRGREPYAHETDWKNTEIEHVTSSCVFPIALASVSKTWREVMSMLTPAWSRVIIFVDAPDCLTFARSQVEWSRRTMLPIDLVVSNQDSRRFSRSSDEEGEVLRSIFDIVQPLFYRCRTILFRVTYTSSLPRLASDFPDVAPNLETLWFQAEVPNSGYQGFMDGTLPVHFPFPSLQTLEIDGWNFVELSINAIWWLESLCQNKASDRNLKVTHYLPMNGQGKTVRLLMNDLLPILDKMKSLSFEEVDFASDLDIDSTADDSPSQSSLTLSGLCARLTALLLADRYVESVTIRRCSLSRILFAPSVYFLDLCDIDYPDSTGDLRDMLRFWEGRKLRVTNCPGFDDSVIKLFSEPIPTATPGKTSLRGLLSTLSIIQCHGFSIAALRKMIDARNAYAAAHESEEDCDIDELLLVEICNVPDLNAEDRNWFKRLFGEDSLDLHDEDVFKRTGVWPTDKTVIS
ncbi:hypothetical protein H0H92_008259 [Tricholoma furcatifolium]|nr:hypothetical protein H0H92_008259 [Tricholoma furcatifolium]